MNRRRFAFSALSLISLIGLPGCAVSTGFTGSGKLTDLSDDDTVTIGLTTGQIDGSVAERTQFWENSAAVIASLGGQQGYVGHDLRRELLGKLVWTMTVWRDEEALDAFVWSPVHQKAMRESIGVFENARFARLSIPARELPLPWARARAALEASDRIYAN